MALTAKRKAEIAKELQVASTWVGGPRKTKLLALSAEIGGETEEAAAKTAEKQAAAPPE